MEPMPPAVEVQRLNHWTVREVPLPLFFTEDSEGQRGGGGTEEWGSGQSFAPFPLFSLQGQEWAQGRGTPSQHLFSEGPAHSPSGRVQSQVKLGSTSLATVPLWVSISSNVRWKSYDPCFFPGPDKD